MSRVLVACGAGVLALAALVAHGARSHDDEPVATTRARSARIDLRVPAAAPALAADEAMDEPVAVAHEPAPVAREPAPTEAVRDDLVFRDARAALERDLADGQWSAADRDRLNAALPQLTADQAQVLFAMVFPALNSGAVTSDIAGPPL